MNRILFLFVLIFISPQVFASASEVKDSIGVAKINNKLHIRYLVSPGETIYGISTKFGVAVTELLETNPELENGLKVGQVINIPYYPELVRTAKKDDQEISKPKPADNAVIHKVQPGETLYSLSKKYDVPVTDLLKWNNLELKAGQEIVVGHKDQNAPKTTTSVSPEPVVESPAAKPEVKKPLDEIKVSAPVENKPASSGTVYDFDPTMKQVLIIPFDPYLYFSDADDEIAAKSNIPRTKVRQMFRRRLNALLDHSSYENIHLLGGRAKDSLSDLNRIYSSVTYNYQEILESPYALPAKETQENTVKKTNKNWLEKQKEKIMPEESSNKSAAPTEKGKYFGVIVRNPELFTYFNTKYSIDYYIFVNQFEVKTNYENCLDRAAQNYERTFITHYSIFDSSGKQLAGNKFKTRYNSNSNNIMQIVGDNMPQVAEKILADLPSPKTNVQK